MKQVKDEQVDWFPLDDSQKNNNSEEKLLAIYEEIKKLAERQVVLEGEEGRR
jgi:hypothetical protein